MKRKIIGACMVGIPLLAMIALLIYKMGWLPVVVLIKENPRVEIEVNHVE